MRKQLLIVVLSAASAIAPAKDINTLIERYSEAYRLDKHLVHAVMRVESGYRINAVSNKNARGLMQVIPATAKRMGIDPRYLFNPEHNIAAGTRYLAYLNQMFNGNLDYILAGYNAGEGAVIKHRGIPPYRETRNYVRSVKSRYTQLAQGGSIPAPAPVSVAAARPVSVEVLEPNSVQTLNSDGLFVSVKPLSGHSGVYTLDQTGNFVGL